jgi:hypothetical protein
MFANAGTAAPAGVVGTAGVQTVTISGTPTGGTFVLNWNGQSTAPIAYNATGSAVQAALNALKGLATVTVTGGPGPATPYVATFPAIVAQVAMTATAAFTGGGTIAVAQTTPGVQTTNSALAVPSAAWNDAGWCDQKGITVKTNVSSNDVKAFGNTQVIRTIISEQKKTLDLTFLETNAVTQAVYNSLPLGSVTPDASGFFTIATGAPKVNQYAVLIDTVDGNNHVRFYAPYAQVITPGDLNMSMGQPLTYPAQLVLYPDSTGSSLYQYEVIGALAV